MGLEMTWSSSTWLWSQEVFVRLSSMKQTQMDEGTDYGVCYV
jgi:hypothetical protein